MNKEKIIEIYKEKSKQRGNDPNWILWILFALIVMTISLILGGGI